MLTIACLLWSHAELAQAQSVATEISSFKLERIADEVLLSANLNFELPSTVEDALMKGVPMVFVAQVEIFRERWYWTNKKVVSVERQMRLAYQPLTRRWRLNVSANEITNSGLGVALNQNFENLSEALTTIQRLSRWKIADVTEIDLDQRHQIEFRFRLDLSQLPRPFQIGMLGQTDWNISVAASQPLVLESSK
jgi:hypothetical protein